MTICTGFRNRKSWLERPGTSTHIAGGANFAGIKSGIRPQILNSFGKRRVSIEADYISARVLNKSEVAQASFLLHSYSCRSSARSKAVFILELDFELQLGL